MKEFNLKKYLSEGRLTEDNNFEKNERLIQFIKDINSLRSTYMDDIRDNALILDSIDTLNNLIQKEIGFEKGGQIDYFEQYDKLPSKPRKIVEKYQEKMEEGDYDFKDSADFLKEMEAEGYTFEYGLDNEPYDLHKMAKGGKLQTIDFNDFKDKLIILRVTPPSQGGPGGNPGGDPGKEEVNVKNPFEKDKKQPKEKPDKDKKGKDNKGKEKPGGDDKGKDKAGEDDKGKDKKGKDKKGKAKNKPDEDNSTRGKPQKGFESQSEDEENTKLNLSKLEEALGTSDIKKTFRNRTNVEIALTGKKVFDTDNDKKISESLDKIFK